MKKRFAIFTSLLLLALFTNAQEEYIQPPSKRLTKFTFTQLSGGVVMIHARLDNFPDTLNFIFDTGSSGISLDSTTVDYFNLKPQPTERTIRGIAGIKIGRAHV